MKSSRRYSKSSEGKVLPQISHIPHQSEVITEKTVEYVHFKSRQQI